MARTGPERKCRLGTVRPERARLGTAWKCRSGVERCWWVWLGEEWKRRHGRVRSGGDEPGRESYGYNSLFNN